MYREWKEIEVPKEYCYMNLETRPTVRPRNRWQEKVYNTEEWKKLLRMVRNCRILHMAMEGWNKYNF
jgi:hypothetical protein